MWQWRSECNRRSLQRKGNVSETQRNATQRNVVECLIMSKLDYNDIVSHPIPEYLAVSCCWFRPWTLCKQARCTQAGMVAHKWTQRKSLHYILFLELCTLITAWPSYLKLDIHNPGRTLRPSTETTLKIPLDSGTFQDSASKVFNILPSTAKNSAVFKTQVKIECLNIIFPTLSYSCK